MKRELRKRSKGWFNLGAVVAPFALYGVAGFAIDGVGGLLVGGMMAILTEVLILPAIFILNKP